MTGVKLFVFNRWAVVDLSVEPAMVEPIDVFGHGDLELVDVRPRPLVPDEFGLEQRVERLGKGIVIRVALGTAAASSRRWV